MKLPCRTYETGDIRYINRFLFFPKRIFGERRWLEFVCIKQRATQLSYTVYWHDICFIDDEGEDT
jgi:hypothetical protein